MIKKIMKYLGDKAVEVTVFNREEFLKAHPRSPVVITTPTETLEFPMGPDEIFCDLCSNDPGNEIYLLNSKAYCTKCYEPLAKYTK